MNDDLTIIVISLTGVFVLCSCFFVLKRQRIREMETPFHSLMDDRL